MTFQGAPVHHVDLDRIEAAVGETVEGRTGGAVSLAVGMAMIFSSLPGMNGLLAYWYHFAIMFEALFILTTIDSGTRVGRFILSGGHGQGVRPFAQPNWLPGACSPRRCSSSPWGYFIYTGNINTIWPMFGVANQLLGCVALAVATTILINTGKAKYTLGDDGAADVPRDEHVLRRLPQHPRQLLAAGDRRQPGRARAGLRPVDLHGSCWSWPSSSSARRSPSGSRSLGNGREPQPAEGLGSMRRLAGGVRRRRAAVLRRRLQHAASAVEGWMHGSWSGPANSDADDHGRPARPAAHCTHGGGGPPRACYPAEVCLPADAAPTPGRRTRGGFTGLHITAVRAAIDR